MNEVLCLQDVTYKYNNKKLGNANRMIVDSVSADFERGKLYAVMGRSGSGKTTLLSLMAGLDIPKGGDILFEGNSLKKIDRNHYRSHNIGMVFQQFNLLPLYNAIENVQVSLELCGYPMGKSKQRAIDLLIRVGLSDDLLHRSILRRSGGEQQRVAIARALSSDPSLILCDEPTGNLDSQTGDDVMDLLQRLAHEDDKCVIVVTHATAIGEMADDVFVMRDGKLLHK